MKTKLLEIAHALDLGTIDDKKARTLLLNLLGVSGCLSHEETKRFYQLMLKWEEDKLIDYSLMKGADYMQRTLAFNVGC